MTLPFVYTPHPVVSMPPETLYEYLEGDDPLTGKRVIDEIVDALTKDPGCGRGGPRHSAVRGSHGPRGPGRARHRGQPPAPVLRTRLDRRPSDHPSHRGTGGEHAHRHRSASRRAGRRDLPSRHQGNADVLGPRHRRGGSHGRGPARAPPRDPGCRGDQTVGPDALDDPLWQHAAGQRAHPQRDLHELRSGGLQSRPIWPIRSSAGRGP